ncbi:DNA-binding protein WhiA [Ruminococcaceae bacterium OttesenSCG-928-O06]|nr:DNA-binding protein WhiA [Ruminococcaceae bacterium OttesenSCG-928-O06]
MAGEKKAVSFSQQVKKEVMQRQVENPCCVAAVCYGIACFSKYFDARGVVLHTEQAYTARWAKTMFRAAGVAGNATVRGRHAASYEFAVKDPYEVEKMLAMFGHSGEETALRLNGDNLNCSGCVAGFVGAAFVCCGTVVNPELGYTLEFVSPRYSLMRDFAALLQHQGFSPKLTNRKGANVLYLKASEQIEDLLTTMGASLSAMEIMNLKVYKGLRNQANRVTNCETANIDKMVNANLQMLEAIRLLEERDILGALPAPLQQAAALRKAFPEHSLAELAAASDVPVSKSGLSHRFKKLREKAAEIQENPHEK